jgi:N-acetylmuramoyl-L-alanine amidase
MRHAGDMGRVRTGAGTKKHEVALAVSKRMQSELRGPLEATEAAFS